MFVGETEERAGSERTRAAMRNMDGGGWAAQAVGRVGQRGESKADEKANWSNYYSIKSQPWESKVLHLNSAGERDGAIC